MSQHRLFRVRNFRQLLPRIIHFYSVFCLDFKSNDLWWSPQAKETIGMMDDIFIHDGAGTFTFNQDRFNEKVMTRWDEMEVRTFRAKTKDNTD